MGRNFFQNPSIFAKFSKKSPKVLANLTYILQKILKIGATHTVTHTHTLPHAQSFEPVKHARYTNHCVHFLNGMGLAHNRHIGIGLRRSRSRRVARIT